MTLKIVCKRHQQYAAECVICLSIRKIELKLKTQHEITAFVIKINIRTARFLHKFIVSENSLCSLCATNAAYQLSQITLQTKTPPRLLVFLVYRLLVSLAFVCAVVYVFMFFFVSSVIFSLFLL